MRRGGDALRRSWPCLPLMLALACAESHVPGDGTADAGPRDGAVMDAFIDMSTEAPDEGPLDLGPRQDVGPLVCGPLTARVYLEAMLREEVVVLGQAEGESPWRCWGVGVRVTRDVAQALLRQPGVACYSWWEPEESLCYLVGSNWHDPAYASDFCWLDTLTGGEQEWVCQRYLE
jgi:hypothetical protein